MSHARVGALLYAAGALLVALSAWLFLARATGGTRIVICVVDTSASARRVRPTFKRDLSVALASQATRARELGAQFAVLAFGADVRRVFGPGSPAEFEKQRLALESGDDGASPLARALDLARDLALADGRAGARVVVFSDGTWTGSDPRPRIAELAEAGVDVELGELAPPELVDVAIAGLDLPRTIEAKAPVLARVDLRAIGPLQGRSVELTLVCSNTRGETTHKRTVPLAPALSVDVELGAAAPGRTLVRATARLVGAPGDPISENDSRTASVASTDAIAVVVAARAELDLPDAPGIAVTTIAPSDVGHALGDAAVLVTAGLRPNEIPRELVEPFVRRGGGWLAFAGSEWLEPQASNDIRELSPLVPAADPGDARSVLLLVDGSGSMTGAPFDAARAAVLRLSETAPARGRIDLRIFAAALGEPISIRGERVESTDAVRARLSQALPSSAPGGPTRLFDALEELARSNAPLLVVLLSDGRDDSAADARATRARAQAVREQLVAAHIELRAIAAGSAANQDLLAALVPESQPVMRADALDDAALAALFEHEIARGSFREGRALSVLPAASAPEGSLAAAILSTRDERTPWPSIQRYLRMRTTENAELVCVAESGEPLLAIQRVGRGFAATVAFSPDGVLRADPFVPVLRALGRARADGPTIAAGAGRLIVDGLPVDAPAELEARIALPGKTVRARLWPDVASADPRVVRSGPCPVELDESAAPVIVPVELAAPGGEALWTALLEIASRAEFDARASTAGELDAALRKGARRPRDGSAEANGAAARNVLAAGLLCLFAGAVLGALRRAPLPETGRREARSQAH